jgi:hypothetical protein
MKKLKAPVFDLRFLPQWIKARLWYGHRCDILKYSGKCKEQRSLRQCDAANNWFVIWVHLWDVYCTTNHGHSMFAWRFLPADPLHSPLQHVTFLSHSLSLKTTPNLTPLHVIVLFQSAAEGLLPKNRMVPNWCIKNFSQFKMPHTSTDHVIAGKVKLLSSLRLDYTPWRRILDIRAKLEGV